MTSPDERIPALINTASGTADEARAALEGHEGFAVHEVAPTALRPTLRALAEGGARRVLVAGGDGTIAAAADALVETRTELAILPGGTLNHFARDLGISTVAADALAVAATHPCRGVDVGEVNGRIFLNTSSVGAYVHFVRARERLERILPYRLASAIAAVRLLFEVGSIAVQLEVDGTARVYRSPLVFIGVGERELQLPTLGNRVPHGRRGLHVLVVRSRSRARLLALALAAVARGIDSVARSPELDSFIVERCTLMLRRRRRTVALDGELVRLTSPLEYRLRRDALAVVCPPDEPRSGRANGESDG